MKINKLLAFSVFLLVTSVAWNAAGCTAINNVGHAQTNNANRSLSNSATKNANSYNVNLNTLNGNSNFAVQNRTEEKKCDVELAESPRKRPPTYDLKISTNGAVTLNEATRKSLNEWFTIFADAGLQPFPESKAEDNDLILFAVNRLFGLGRLGTIPEEQKKETERCKNSETNYETNECTARVDEKEIETVINKYFLLPIKKHGFLEKPSMYKNGCYYCGDACCADGEMTFNFAVVEKMIPLKSDYYLAEVKNYEGWHSLYSECNSDCNRKRLQEIKNASEVNDFETIMKLCPQWEATPIDKIRAKIRIVTLGKEIRPILVSYEKIESYTKK